MIRFYNRALLKNFPLNGKIAYEICEIQKNELVCIAYITTRDQWERFLNTYNGWIQVFNISSGESSIQLLLTADIAID